MSRARQIDVTTPVSVGDILGGKYRVERVLGEGGMGVVVAATHLQLQERVALKFMLLEASQQSETVARFLREAQAAVKIKSEHVARVTDVGTLDSGAPYMVMEYLDGEDLAAVLARSGTVSVPLAVEYVVQACAALGEAHRAGIIHRDLKPSNLFLVQRSDGSPCIKLLDFGISKVTNQGLGGSKALTTTHGIMGTPYYMSPEQLRSSRDVDARTDIWSLGVILFELMTGEVPFEADTVPDLCVAVLTKPAPRLRERAPGLPIELDEIVHKCLRKDPDDRFASVGELARALAALAPEYARHSVDRILRTSQSTWRPKAPDTTRIAPPASSRSLAETKTAPPDSDDAAVLERYASPHATSASPVSRPGRLVRIGGAIAAAAAAVIALGLASPFRSESPRVSASPQAEAVAPVAVDTHARPESSAQAASVDAPSEPTVSASAAATNSAVAPSPLRRTRVAPRATIKPAATLKASVPSAADDFGGRK